MNLLAKTSLVAAVASVMVSGCVQMPTEARQVADLRPGISFQAQSSRAASSQVFVDGLNVGSVADYLDGKGILRVLPGTHVLRVVDGASVLLEEKVYLGDGVNRAFIVK